MRRLSVLVVACVSVLTAGCLNVLTPPGDAPLRYRDDVFTNVTTTPNITYGSAHERAGPGAIARARPVSSRPATPSTAGPRSCGSTAAGSRGGNKTSTEIVAQAQAFARKGYFNVSIEYRLVAGGCSAGGVTQACLRAIVDAQHDAQAAVRFLRANAVDLWHRPDAHRLGRDVRRRDHRAARRVQLRRPGHEREPGLLVGRAARPCRSRARSSSAGRLPTDPPSLSFHGTNDFVVPYQWAVNTVNRIRRRASTHYLTRSRARATSRSPRQLPDDHRPDPQLPLLRAGPRARRSSSRSRVRHSGGVTDGLDVVAVGVADERAEVGRVVLGEHARLVQHLGTDDRPRRRGRRRPPPDRGAVNAMCTSRESSPVVTGPIQKSGTVGRRSP